MAFVSLCCNGNIEWRHLLFLNTAWDNHGQHGTSNHGRPGTTMAIYSLNENYSIKNAFIYAFHFISDAHWITNVIS